MIPAKKLPNDESPYGNIVISQKKPGEGLMDSNSIAEF